MTVKPVPEGYHTITPYIMVPQAEKLLTFLGKAFGAEEVAASRTPDGLVMNAEIRIGDSMVMIADSREHPAKPAMIYMYVEDVDSLYKSAMAAGGKSIMEPADQFYGDRNAAVEDPNGGQWWIAARVEELTPEEVLARAKKQYGG